MRITSSFANTCEVLSALLFKHTQWRGTETHGPWASTARLAGRRGAGEAAVERHQVVCYVLYRHGDT